MNKCLYYVELSVGRERDSCSDAKSEESEPRRLDNKLSSLMLKLLFLGQDRSPMGPGDVYQ